MTGGEVGTGRLPPARHVPRDGATKVLVTGAGGPAGRALGEQLAARAGAGIECVGVDIVPVQSPHFAVTDVVPRADDPGYSDGMRAAIRRYLPDLVVPTVQDELPEVAVLAELFGMRLPSANGTRPRVVISSAATTAVTCDKLFTMWALARCGAPVPKFAPATDFDDTAAAIAWADGRPVVVKPRRSRGGRGVRLVERPQDLDWVDTDASWIVQSFAGGTEYNPQVYRSPVTGRTTVVVLEKTVLKEGRVGNAAEVVRLDDGTTPDVVEVATRVAKALDLVGPLDMDVRRDDRGVPVVLEVNSRFGANSTYAPELLDAVLAEWLGGTR
jgi:carbamoylphosphate synthase large subunit